MPSTQAHRFLAIETALGADALLIRSFSIQEQMGRLFQIDVQLASEGPDVDFDKVVGTNATVRLTLPSGKTRYFNGFMSRFQQIGDERGQTLHRAVLVPWLWFLTRTSDCRIFQKKKVPDIIEAVFKAHGFKDYKLKLSGTYREWEYCVQYRESDFNFVSRLMEQEGIYYFFLHENGLHTLILADSASAHEAFEDYATIPFKPRTQQEEMAETVTDWIIEKELQSGAVALSDFNFKTPASPITVTADIGRAHETAHLEIFDYPGEYDVRAEGEAYAKIRIQELQSQHEVLRAQTTARGIAVGSKFTLKGHYRADQAREYLITRSSLDATSGSYGSGGSGSGGGEFFSGQFTAIPTTEIFRAPRQTPKPSIQGPQTAIVVGKAGEEIDTDEFGRVKVQFHWDRYGKMDENSSCWVRVAQAWAGKGWGAIYLPRIGQEVVVEFLEGDPDHPLITGRVYNAVAKVPYPLPDNKTMSTLKSNSSKGGQGFNEIRFEDKKGSEQVFIHAEKNQDHRVKNDSMEWIGHDRHLVVGNDQVEEVDNDRQEKIKRDHVEEIGRDRHTKIEGKEAKEVTKTLSVKIGDDVGIQIGGNLHEKITKEVLLEAKTIVLKATENITLKIGEDKVYIAMTSAGIKLSAASGDIALEATNISSKASAGFKAEAGAEASIKGTAGLKLESSATAEMKSPMTTVKGDGMLTLKGGMTMIN